VSAPLGEFSVFRSLSSKAIRTSRSRYVYACLDTGYGSGGPLTVLLWPERKYLRCDGLLTRSSWVISHGQPMPLLARAVAAIPCSKSVTTGSERYV